MRRMLWVVPVVAVFVVGGIGLFRARPVPDLGGRAPAFELRSLAGDGEVGLSDLRGKPAVLNFWASWCEPCKDEAAEFARTARRHADDVHFLGIVMLDERTAPRRFVAKYDIPYDSGQDTRGVVAKRYGVTGVPETMFIDAQGRLVGRYIGAFTDGQLEGAIGRFLRLEPGQVLRLTGRGETRPVP
jgi:cytochrome c biogenesis protein CcmG/thiol:disulfide interchange protein DsbE